MPHVRGLVFNEGVGLKVGLENKVHFWFDDWVVAPLCCVFPILGDV